MTILIDDHPYEHLGIGHRSMAHLCTDHCVSAARRPDCAEAVAAIHAAEAGAGARVPDAAAAAACGEQEAVIRGKRNAAHV